MTYKLITRSFIRNEMPKWLMKVERRLLELPPVKAKFTQSDWHLLEELAQLYIKVARKNEGSRCVVNTHLATDEGCCLLVLRNGIPILSIYQQ